MDVIDPRKELDFKEDISRKSAYGKGQIISPMICEILDANGIEYRSEQGVDLGCGNGYLLDEHNRNGLKMFGIEAAMRGEDDRGETDVIKGNVENLHFIQDNSIAYSVSTLLFDDTIYNQDQEKIKSEISRILSDGGIHLGFEYFADLGQVPQMVRRNIEKHDFDRRTTHVVQVYKKGGNGEIIIPGGIMYRQGLVGAGRIFT